MSTASTQPAPTPESLRDGMRALKRALVACFAVMFASIVAMSVAAIFFGPLYVFVVPGVLIWMVAFIIALPLVCVRHLAATRLIELEAK